jgi:hypothetical protein
LSSYPRHRRLYPAGHPRITLLLQELLAHLKAAFDDSDQPLILVVRGDTLDIDDVPLKTTAQAIRDLAAALSRRRVHVLRIFPQILQAELHLLADFLGTDHKEILRRGGPEVFLATHSHPNVEVVPFEDSTLADAVIAAGGSGLDTSGLGLPQHLVPAFKAILSSPETRARVDRLRNRVRRYRERRPWAGDTIEVIEKVLRALLEQMDTSDFDADRMREVLNHFLDLLEHRLRTGADELPRSVESDSERVAKLLAFALELPQGERAPELLQKLAYLKELLRPHTTDAGTEARPRKPGHGQTAGEEPGEASVAFDIDDLSDVTELSQLEFAEEKFRTELEGFPVEDMYLRIICEMMLTAGDAERYGRHREQFLRALTIPGRSTEAVSRILLYVACHMPQPPFENRQALLREALPALGGGEAVGSFFLGMREHPDGLEGALRVVMREEAPFSTLARLLLDDRLTELRKRVETSFLGAAQRVPGALSQWIHRDADTAFHPRIFRLLMKLGPDYLPGVAREIFQRGAPAERRRLIQALAEEGGGAALDLLLLGLAGAERGRSESLHERIGELLHRSGADDDFLEALASFKHPRAVDVLCEIVEHSNAGGASRRQAATAIRSLARVGTRSAREFLRRVAEERRWFRYRYHSELRTLAAQLLLQGGA